jgi:hypothetical protein
VFLGRSARLECPQISSLPGLRILLPRIQSVTSGPKFPDHWNILSLTKNLSSINRAIAHEKKKPAEHEIEREMRCEAPVFARMAEAAAGGVNATDFCGDGGDDERSPKSRRDLRLSPAECLPRSD